MYKLSHYYNEPAIFRNLVYAILVALVSITVTAILEGVFIFASFAQLPTPSQNAPVFSGFLYLGIIAVSIGLSIVSGFFVMRTFNKLKDKSGIDSFGTAGLLYIVGTVVPIVGWIAWIFASIGFNKLKPTTAQSHFYQTQYSATPTQTKSCPNCGTENPPRRQLLRVMRQTHTITSIHQLTILPSSRLIKNLIFEMRFLLDRKVVISLCLLK